jgi:predicted PurR-regulated permease PerM
MDASRIQVRAVAKIAITVLAITAAALVLALVVLHVRTTLRWAVAAIFLALALAPAVGLVERIGIRDRHLPRWAAILGVYVGFFWFFVFVLLVVIPPIVSEVEGLGQSLPTYVSDFEDWAEKNEDFRQLNDKYDITQTLSADAKELPSKLGDAAGEVRDLTVSAANNLFAAITVLALAFFLILDRGRTYFSAVERLPAEAAARWRRIGEGTYRVVKSYVTVTLLSAAMAGVFTWLMLELLGVPLAIPLAVLVAFLDLIPLIGFTLAGVLIAIAAALTDFPTALLVWLVAFLVYQQLQDRVFQPLLFRSAVHLNPAVSIVAVLIGAELLGILGALIAIPTAASIAVIGRELIPSRPAEDEPGTAVPVLGPGPQPEPAAD